MSLAYKCDRCGEFYDNRDHSRINGVYGVNKLCIPFGEQPEELCVECTIKVNRFMAGEELAGDVKSDYPKIVVGKPANTGFFEQIYNAITLKGKG